MTEKELTEADRRRIRSHIILTFILGTVAALGLIVLLFMALGTAYLMGFKPAHTLSMRIWLVVGCICMLIPLLASKNILKMIEIFGEKKVVLVTDDFYIEKQTDRTYLVSTLPPLKIEIYDALVPMLKPSVALNIELTKLSKTVLFISHDHENLMERVESEHE